MARKLRIHYEEAVYHVIVRGNNRAGIFELAEDKDKYLAILADYKKKYGFCVFAYVIMDNHAHLLLRVGKTPLSKIMQGLQQRYTQYYNWQRQRTGHVFEQRYKAFLCDGDNYLLTLICYIHQNPVKANMPEGVAYQWSSHHVYLNQSNGLVNATCILEMLNANPDKAVHEYVEMMNTPMIEPEYKSSDVREHEDVMKEDARKEEEQTEKPELTWDKLVETVVVEKKIEQDELIGRCRKRNVVAARKYLIREAIERGLMTRTELARLLQIDPANITRILATGSDMSGE